MVLSETGDVLSLRIFLYLPDGEVITAFSLLATKSVPIFDVLWKSLVCTTSVLQGTALLVLDLKRSFIKVDDRAWSEVLWTM